MTTQTQVTTLRDLLAQTDEIRQAQATIKAELDKARARLEADLVAERVLYAYGYASGQGGR